MLQAMHAGFNRMSHLIGHALPQEALTQQRQGMVTSLMTHIPVAPIQGSGLMGPGDHKE